MKMVVKKMKVIAKVSPDRFVKYNVQDLVSFARYLDRSFPDWRWMNVYDKNTGNQVCSFTRNHRPTTKHVVV